VKDENKKEEKEVKEKEVKEEKMDTSLRLELQNCE
jgi:hypothetical protein